MSIFCVDKNIGPYPQQEQDPQSDRVSSTITESELTFSLEYLIWDMSSRRMNLWAQNYI